MGVWWMGKRKPSNTGILYFLVTAHYSRELRISSQLLCV
ncbi:hypothetical protein [Azospirillum argentinense]